jgi:hypothetical protein
MKKFYIDFLSTDPIINILYNLLILKMTETFPETLIVITDVVLTLLGDLL